MEQPTIFKLTEHETKQIEQQDQTHPYTQLKHKLSTYQHYQSIAKTDQSLLNANLNHHTITHLKQTINNIHLQLQSQHINNQHQLKPQHFQSIFQPQPSHQYYNHPNSNNLQKQYYQQYILNNDPDDHHNHHDLCFQITYKNQQNQTQKFKHKYQRIQQLLQNQLIDQQQQVDNQIKQKYEVCKNSKINQAMKPVFSELIQTYYDEIFDCLIDDILIEEVYYLNNYELFKHQQLVEQTKPIEVDNTEYDVYQIVQHLEKYIEE